MRARTVLTVSALALAALLSARPGAQQFVLSSRDRARLVAVDFAVIGSDGMPVADVRPGEVTLKIDGRPRPIRSLEYVSVSASTAPGLDMGLTAYGSNTASDTGRSVVLIVDQETLRPGREAALKTQTAAFLRTLEARDRVALITVPYGGLKVDLTTDHRRINEALAPLIGQAPSVESDNEAACRTSTTLTALRGALDDLRGGEAPVAVVFFSGKLSAPDGIVMSSRSIVVGRCQVRPEQYRQVGAAAAAAHAQFYVVLPELTVEPESRAGLEHLTGVTGGQLWPLGGGADASLARIAHETGGYYVARLEPEPSETTGTIRGLDISVSRPGTAVRQRPNISITRPNRFAAAKPSTPLVMMKDARIYRDLPLRVSAYSSRGTGSSQIRVVTIFDSPDPSAAMSSAMIGLFDDQGRMVTSRQLEGAELVGTPVISALSAPPGRYRLRVAATEAAGRSGAADDYVDAELRAAGPLRMSALVLGLSRAGQFVPRLEFGSEAAAVAHLEVYGAGEGDVVGSVFELSRTANGPALMAVRGLFEATSEPDRFTLTAALPIGALPPGDYVVRATVAAEGSPGGRVLRALRKVIR